MLVAEDLYLTAADGGVCFPAMLDIPHFAPAVGSLTAIAGRSSEGKSTFLNILAGFLPPQHGTVHFDGIDMYAMPASRRDVWRWRRIAHIPGVRHCQPAIAATADLPLPRMLSPAPGSVEWGEAFLEGLGVPTAAGSVELVARGELQRMAIASAVACNPRVILADEPTEGLDRAAADNLCRVLRRMADDGKTVVVASRDRSVLDRADPVFVLRHGCLAEAAAVPA